jgi:aromatic-L-amino-acid decarboxylase
MDYGVSLGRRFRALKLWLVMRTYGIDGLAARIREHVRLAQLFRSWVEDDEDWEVVAPVAAVGGLLPRALRRRPRGA